ncbi:hypothetical protein J7J18_02855 [bacterium]|nr:hypothetical protein [bacterium]
MSGEEKEVFKESPEELAKRIFEEIQEKKERGEEKEFLTAEEKIIKEKLRREIELMKINPELQDEARKKAQEIKELDVQGKIKNLLLAAEQEGVAFAVKIAEGLKDSYLLDVFHDILARDGLFKRFKK